jgi:hypothetical protein
VKSTGKFDFTEMKMNKLLTAIALSIALPAVAHAQAAPAPEAKQDCCEKMKSEGKECCCEDMAKDGHSEHGAQQPKSGEHHAHQH